MIGADRLKPPKEGSEGLEIETELNQLQIQAAGPIVRDSLLNLSAITGSLNPTYRSRLLVLASFVGLASVVSLLPVKTAFADAQTQTVNTGNLATPSTDIFVNPIWAGKNLHLSVTLTDHTSQSGPSGNDNYTLVILQSGQQVYNGTAGKNPPVVSAVPGATTVFEVQTLSRTQPYTVIVTLYAVNRATISPRTATFNFPAFSDQGKQSTSSNSNATTPEFPLTVPVTIAAAGAVTVLMRFANRTMNTG